MKIKKILAAALSVAAGVSILCGAVFAESAKAAQSGAILTALPPAGASPSDYPEYPNEGSVQMQKSAEWTNAQKGEATIHFSVAGVPGNAGVDVVLVIDRSGTMAIPAVQNAVCGQPTANYNVQDGPALSLPKGYYSKFYSCPVCGHMEIISYNEKGEPVQAKKDAHGNVIRPVQYVPAPGLPQTCPGNTSKTRIQLTKEAVSNFIGLMMKENADGTPSQNRIGIVSFDTTAETNMSFSGQEQRAQLLSAVSGLFPRGDTNYTAAFEAVQRLLSAREEADRPAYVVFLTDGNPDPANKTGTAAAEQIKQDPNVKIYTVGLGDEIKKPDLLSRLSSGAGYTYLLGDQDDLSGLYGTIAKNMRVAGTEAVLTDLIDTDYFTYDSSRAGELRASAGTAKEQNNQVSWTIGEINENRATLSIPVKLKPRYINTNGSYPTNIPGASLRYQNYAGNACVQTVASPYLPVQGGMIRVAPYLVNGEGRPVNGEGTVIPFSQRIEAEPYYVEDPSSLAADKKLLPVGPRSVSARESIVYRGAACRYEPKSAEHGGMENPAQVTVENGETRQVYFGYRLPSYPVRVEYYAGSVQGDNFLGQTALGDFPYGVTIDRLRGRVSLTAPAGITLPDGYGSTGAIDESSMQVVTELADKNVIRVVFSPAASAGYTVRYYRDRISTIGESGYLGSYQGSASANTTITLSETRDEGQLLYMLPQGYHLSNRQANRLRVTEDERSNILDVLYLPDPLTPPARTAYTVLLKTTDGQYEFVVYQDEAEDGGQIETVDQQKLAQAVSRLPNGKYQLSRYENLPLTVRKGEENVIVVYFDSLPAPKAELVVRHVYLEYPQFDYTEQDHIVTLGASFAAGKFENPAPKGNTDPRLTFSLERIEAGEEDLPESMNALAISEVPQEEYDVLEELKEALSSAQRLYDLALSAPKLAAGYREQQDAPKDENDGSASLDELKEAVKKAQEKVDALKARLDELTADPTLGESGEIEKTQTALGQAEDELGQASAALKQAEEEADLEEGSQKLTEERDYEQELAEAAGEMGLSLSIDELDAFLASADRLASGQKALIESLGEKLGRQKERIAALEQPANSLSLALPQSGRVEADAQLMLLPGKRLTITYYYKAAVEKEDPKDDPKDDPKNDLDPPTPPTPPTPPAPPAPVEPRPDRRPSHSDRDDDEGTHGPYAPVRVPQQGDGTVTIEDEAVPLGKLPALPQNPELVTIEDEMIPLGKLPVSGGRAAEAAQGMGILILAAGVLILRQSKK